MRITDKYAAVIPLDEASPVAFLNVFESGDVWVKIKSCLDCSVEQRKKCCGRCPCVLPDGGCLWHTKMESVSRKPFYCMFTPEIYRHNSRCALEYKCIAGSKKGKIRRLKDKLNIFVDGA